MTRKSANRLLSLAFVLFVGASMSYYVLQTVGSFRSLERGADHARMPFRVDDDLLTIDDLRPEALAAGLRPGDRLLQVRGEPYRGRTHQIMLWGGGTRFARAGEPLPVVVEGADGRIRRATLRSESKGPVNHTVLDLAIRALVQLLPLVCLLVGYWVAAARIRDPNAWLLLILFAAPSVLSSTPDSWPGAWMWLDGWRNILEYATAPALLLFGVYFPERWRLDRRAPWAKWILLAPLAAGFVLLPAILWVEYLHAPEMGRSIAPAARWLGRLIGPLDLACVLVYMAAVLDKLRSATTADARRRLRVLAAGSAVGLSSLLAVFVLWPHLGFQPESHPWITLPAFLLFFAAPFSFAYVVVVQRALDVRILLRMGTRYALARATLLAAEIGLVAFVLLRFVVPLLRRRENLPLTIPLLILVGAGLIKLFAAQDSLSHRLQRWLDRRFFREAYDAELVLNELSEQARRYSEAGPLLELVSRRIAEVLHVSPIAVYMRRGRGFTLERSVGMEEEAPARFEESSSTVRNLSRSNQPATLYRENPDGWFLLADDRERRSLDRLRTELLLPLCGRDRLLGFLSLGPKRSEEPYTASDLRLLQSVAAQAGLALEISELAHSLAREAAQRERIDREIEIAREVQERLFPQEIPALPGVSIHGGCRPAQGVGGDYYDVIPMENGLLGLAIGDVSGKGISAALLMASLRASLRGMTMDGQADLAVLLARVNRLVYESSASNRYATFFFAIYEPGSRLLRYVNAGHNPPYVLRGACELPLEGGGMVIGLLPDAEYREFQMTLQPGDLLLAYTDGISEALNPEEQEWGEERMMDAARRSAPAHAGGILRHIMDEADRFAANAPQHDDMTLLLMKLETVPAA